MHMLQLHFAALESSVKFHVTTKETIKAYFFIIYCETFVSKEVSYLSKHILHTIAESLVAFFSNTDSNNTHM